VVTRISGSQMTFVHARNLGGFVLIYKTLLALVREGERERGRERESEKEREKEINDSADCMQTCT